MVTYLFLKKLVTPISQTAAYRLKLIDASGKIVREPENHKEEQALTLLDRMILKVKRLLGSRMSNLYNFVYLQTQGERVYNNLLVMGSVQQRAEVRRLANDIRRLQEQHQISSDDVARILLEADLTEEAEDIAINNKEERGKL
jgi:hypothetical protein